MKKSIAICAVWTVLLATLILLTGCPRRGPERVFTAGTTIPITFTFFNADAPGTMPWDDPVAGRITEITGVTLQVDGPVGGADQQAIALMIASGRYPDLIFAKGNLGMLIEAGAVIPLDDLIATKGNHIRELYGDKLGRLRHSLQDPRIYHVGTFGVNEPHWTTDGTLQLQHSVLRELGFPEIRTLADFEWALREYMARNPTINGQPTIGLSLLIGTWQWFISLSNPGNFLIGYPDDGQWIVNQETLEATYKFLHPDMHYWFRWLNRMHAEGILDPESFTQSEDTWQAKIASGRVLSIAYPIWGYSAARTSLINDGMEERTFAFLPVVADERFVNPSLSDPGWGGGWGISISSASRDPERAFEFLNWMASEEAQILVNWGIEGENFIVVDGRRVVPPEEQHRINTDPDHERRTGVGRWVHPFPRWGRGGIDSSGNFITRDSPETIRQNLLPVEVETLAAYDAEMWIDLFPPSEALPAPRHGQAWQYTLPPDLNARVVEADSFVRTALVNMIMGSPDNFDTAWENMVQGLHRIRIDEANRAMTQLIRERVRLWEMER